MALAPLEIQVQVNVYDYMLELMHAKIAVYSFARLFTEVPTHTNAYKHQYVCAVSSKFLLQFLGIDRQYILVP